MRLDQRGNFFWIRIVIGRQHQQRAAFVISERLCLDDLAPDIDPHVGALGIIDNPGIARNAARHGVALAIIARRQLRPQRDQRPHGDEADHADDDNRADDARVERRA